MSVVENTACHSMVLCILSVLGRLIQELQNMLVLPAKYFSNSHEQRPPVIILMFTTAMHDLVEIKILRES